MEFILTDDNGSLTVQLACPECKKAVPSFLVQCEIAFLVNVLCAATKREISPVGVVMQNPPGGHGSRSSSTARFRRGRAMM